MLLALSMMVSFVGCQNQESSSNQSQNGSSENSSTGSGESESGEKIQITYWNQWTQEAEIAFLEKYITEYNQSQDQYEVSYLAIPFDEYVSTKLATAFATGEAPDVFDCSPAIINQYMDAGVCEPLNDILTEEKMALFQEGAFDVCSKDGVIYGIPLDADIVGIYYNKAMLEEAGVEVPKTWSELLDAAVKLNSQDHAGYTFEVDKGDWQCFTFYPFVWMQGGSLFTQDGANLNSPEVVNALQFWKDLLNCGGCNEAPGRSVSDISILTDGETAIQINGSWSVLRADSEQYGVAPLPLPDDGGEPVTVMGGWKIMASSQSSDEEKAGAKDFITWLFLDDPPVHTVEFDTVAKFTFSTRPDVIESASDIYLSNDNAVCFSKEILPTAKSEIAMTAEAKDIVATMIQDALYNMSAQEAADKAQAAMESYFSTYEGAVFVG